MSNKIKLSEKDKVRVKNLENDFKNSIKNANINNSKQILYDLQQILQRYNQITKLMSLKVLFFELVMDNNDLDYAITGFKGVVENVNNNTRIYLEAISYLTLCYIRNGEIENAENLMPEIGKYNRIIKSNEQRNKFKNTILKKIQEETAFYLIRKDKVDKTDIEWDRIIDEAQYLVRTKTEDEIYWLIGNNLPDEIKNSFIDLNNTSIKLLNPNSTKLLKNTTQSEENKAIGQTFYSSFKIVLYSSLCNPESEIYKAWYNGGIRKLMNPSIMVKIIIAALSLTGTGLALSVILVPICALIIKFGIEVYCEKNKPIHLLDAR